MKREEAIALIKKAERFDPEKVEQHMSRIEVTVEADTGFTFDAIPEEQYNEEVCSFVFARMSETMDIDELEACRLLYEKYLNASHTFTQHDKRLMIMDMRETYHENKRRVTITKVLMDVLLKDNKTDGTETHGQLSYDKIC